LTATPNGYFGTGTLSAVKIFQTANSISSTGRVGPATRKAIKNLSCNGGNASSTNSPTVAANPIQSPSATNNSTDINANNLTVISPEASSTLATGTKYRVQWKNYTGAIYSILLEDKYGTGAGYVASSVSGNTYDWDVGKVYSARSNTNVVVTPGVYRIHLRNNGFSSVPDQYSGLFTVLGKPLTINTMIPTTVSNKGDSDVVIYGSGFDSTTRVNFDVYNYGRVIQPDYISHDGKILVFSVPQGFYTGQYSITVNNRYEDGATSTPSNSLNLNVSAQ
jgi:hypothetical protein